MQSGCFLYLRQSLRTLHKQNLSFCISDPDPDLPQTLYQTLISDSRVSANMSTMPDLLPLLFDPKRLRSQFVINFLRHLAPEMVPRLVALNREDIIVKALM